MKKEKVLLGKGRLTWQAMERRTDRYGYIYLINSGSSLTNDFDPTLISPNINKHLGTEGKLIAIVTEARKSTHIGDLFHSVFPRTPEVGQVITLGEGLLAGKTEHESGISYYTVGLKPKDGREEFWLDIRALYDAHEQTVELFFQPNN